MTSRSRRYDQEDGAALIMAVVVVFVVAVLVLALANLATGALRSTSNVKALRTSIQDASTAVTVAIQYERYTPPSIPPPNSLFSCLPNGYSISSSDPGQTATDPISVYCSIFVNAFSDQSRVLDIYACITSNSNCNTSSAASVAILHAQANYNDLNLSGVDLCYNNPNLPITSSSCGGSVTLTAWDNTGADS